MSNRQPRSSPALFGLISLLTLTAVACSSDEDGSEAASVIDVNEMGPGTCLDVAADVGPEISELPLAACGEPHSHEIYSIPLSEEDVYPGFDALESFAEAACLQDFEEYVGISAFDSTLFYSWVVPTLTSWDKEDDREILCVAGNGNGAPLVGTVKNSNR